MSNPITITTMKVEFFDAETNNKRATYNLDDSKWPELEDLIGFVKKLISIERADYAVFRFAGSVYTVSFEGMVQ